MPVARDAVARSLPLMSSGMCWLITGPEAGISVWLPVGGPFEELLKPVGVLLDGVVNVVKDLRIIEFPAQRRSPGLFEFHCQQFFASGRQVAGITRGPVRLLADHVDDLFPPGLRAVEELPVHGLPPAPVGLRGPCAVGSIISTSVTARSQFPGAAVSRGRSAGIGCRACAGIGFVCSGSGSPQRQCRLRCAPVPGSSS